MKMADIRKRGHQIADAIKWRGYDDFAKELHFLFDATKRRKYMRRTDKTTVRGWKTTALVRQVRQLAREGWSHSAILKLLPQIPNIGRISEIISGPKT